MKQYTVIHERPCTGSRFSLTIWAKDEIMAMEKLWEKFPMSGWRLTVPLVKVSKSDA